MIEPSSFILKLYWKENLISSKDKEEFIKIYKLTIMWLCNNGDKIIIFTTSILYKSMINKLWNKILIGSFKEHGFTSL